MLEPLIDVQASAARIHDYVAPDLAKLREDLARYEVAIAECRPDVIVECGTWRGESARWFAARVPEVVTVDVAPVVMPDEAGITVLVGDSADPETAAAVSSEVGGRRAMVVLDSLHTAGHVVTEIELYGPLVARGCYLVVEDGIVRWLPENARGGSPLDAVEAVLASNPAWRRDEQIEGMFPVSCFPAGWWRRAS